MRYLALALTGVIASLGCNAGKALAPSAPSGTDAASPAPAAGTDAAAPPSPTDSDAATTEASDAGPTQMGRVPYRATAIALGSLHACALLDDGHVKCWGSNDYGQLGLGDTMKRNDSSTAGDALPTVDLGTGRRAVAIAAGHYTTCASLDDGSFRCWGHLELTGGTGSHGATPGTMGDALPRLNLGPGRTMRQAAIGYIRAFGLLDDGSVKAWQNDPPVEVRPASASPAVVALTPAFSSLAAALFADGSLAALDSNSQPVFAKQIADLPMSDAIRTIGGSDQTACVALVAGGARCATSLAPRTQGTPSSYAAVAAAELGPTCGLRDDGSVICFGQAASWWVDLNNPATSEPGNLVALGQPAKAIAGGQSDMCALLADGTVKCWSNAPSPGSGLSGITASHPDEPNAGPWLSVDLGTRPGP